MKKPKTVKTILLVMGSLLVLLLCLGFVYRQSIRNYRQRLFVEAALRGEITRMRFLLAVGASVDDPACQTSMCAPPLVAAAFNRSTQPVQLLLDEGSNVNDKMPRGQRALMVADYHGHTDTVKLLLSKGADVNADFEGDTALQWARQNGHADIADLLAKAGAAR